MRLQMSVFFICVSWYNVVFLHRQKEGLIHLYIGRGEQLEDKGEAEPTRKK